MSASSEHHIHSPAGVTTSRFQLLKTVSDVI